MRFEINILVANLICRHPALCIIISITFALFCSLSLLNFTLETDIRRSFSPTNSRFNREERIHNEFYNLTSPTGRFFMIFYARDHSSVLTATKMSEVIKFHDEIQRRIGKICYPFCDANDAVLLFWDSYKNQQNSSKFQNNSATLDFPLSIIDGREYFLGLNFFNVTRVINPETRKVNITYVEKIYLWYFWLNMEPKMANEMNEYVENLFEMSKNTSATDEVGFDVYSDVVANAEMMRGAYDATVLMSLGFFLLLVFVYYVVWRQASCRTLPVMVFATVFSPFLAVITAFGIVSWLGYPLYTVMCVAPFLILGIGVDDAFIMLQSWSSFYRVASTEQRLTRVFVEVVPSISITSFTNTVAFGLGYFTPTPEMSTFCLCTALACLMDYILTFSLFAPLLISCSSYTTVSSQTDMEGLRTMKKIETKFYEHYSVFVGSVRAKMLLLFLLAGILTIATFGVFRLQTSFEPAKAFPYNSRLVHSLNAAKALFGDFFPMKIFVNKAPNISDPYEYKMFYNMISDFEKLPHCRGKEYTSVLLRSYEEFDRMMYEVNSILGFTSFVEYVPNYDNLQLFLETSDAGNYVRLTTDERGKIRPKAFMMVIMAKHIGEWTNRSAFLEDCRAVVQRYPEFNVTVFDSEAALLDFMLTVKEDTIGSVAVTVFCMAVICLIFIRNWSGVFIITFVISSICYVLIGALYWWNADLDPIIMVDILISTGFSVDYTAHIVYKFYQCRGDAKTRILESFNHMFVPVTQAGFSTLLCMLPLIFVRTYALLALAKTVFLVIAIGLFHGFFVLPVLLCTFYAAPKDSTLRQKLALLTPDSVN